MIDVVAMGELLVDFTPGAGSWEFAANPGGAPANLLAQMNALGFTTAFMGMVGKDAFGRHLAQTLENIGVDTQGLKFHPETPTTLAFVHIDGEGERDFTFYRNPGADTQFAPGDIDYALLEECGLFHFGGVSLSAGPMREATLEAATFAKRIGKMVSFDPNYRPPLWESPAEAAGWMEKGLVLCDILKVSEEEALLLTGAKDVDGAARVLLSAGPSLVMVTMGAKGSACYHSAHTGHYETYDTKVVDTTGAGDSFFGAALARYMMHNTPLETLNAAQLSDMMEFGNAAGSSCAAGYGAIPSMPGEEAILTCMARVPKLRFN